MNFPVFYKQRGAQWRARCAERRDGQRIDGADDVSDADGRGGDGTQVMGAHVRLGDYWQPALFPVLLYDEVPTLFETLFEASPTTLQNL